MFLSKHDQHIQLKLVENKTEIIREISEYRTNTSREVDSKIRTLEGYTQMIHNSVMHDLESWQGCHQLYLKAAQTFDSKLGVVISLEQSH